MTGTTYIKDKCDDCVASCESTSKVRYQPVSVRLAFDNTMDGPLLLASNVNDVPNAFRRFVKKPATYWENEYFMSKNHEKE
jgi:hypothetical protein